MQLRAILTGKVLEKFKKIEPVARKKLTDGIRDASTYLMEHAIREAPASTGNLRKSIRREITGEGLRASIFTDLEYGILLHGDGISERSRPFKIPAREAMPGGTLYRWAKKLGLNPWEVRASIAKRGIRHNPFFKKTAALHLPELEEMLGKALKDIVVGLAD